MPGPLIVWTGKTVSIVLWLHGRTVVSNRHSANITTSPKGSGIKTGSFFIISVDDRKQMM